MAGFWSRVAALGTSVVCWAAFGVGVGFGIGGLSGAANRTEAAEIRPIVVARCAGVDAAWDAVEKLADSTSRGEIVRAARSAFGGVKGVDGSAPFGFVVATDGDSVAPFAFFPIADFDAVKLPALDALKDKIVKTDAGTFVDSPAGRVELVCRDGWTIFFPAAQKKTILTVDSIDRFASFEENGRDAQSDASNGGAKPLLSVDVDLTAAPEEFVEAGFAFLRQKAAERGVDSNAEELKRFDSLLKYYSDSLASIERLRWALGVDSETGNVVVDASIVCKPGSPLAATFAGARDARTRWGAVAETPNAVVASVAAGVRSERDREFLVDYYRENFFKNLRAQLGVALDSPETLAAANEFVAALETVVFAGLESSEFDVATAISGEPIFATFAATVEKGNALRDAVKTLDERLGERSPELKNFVRVDAETLDGFAVSTLDYPLSELDGKVGLAPYFADKKVAARLGIKDDAVLAVVGFDSDAVVAEFARVAAGASSKSLAPSPSTFAFAPLGRALADLSRGAASIRPVALKTFERIADAKDARIDVSTTVGENRLDLRYVATGEILRTLDDVVKIQARGDASEDESNELDDLFDDEEEESGESDAAE